MASNKNRDKGSNGFAILFVYGTLKRGQRNHGLMREARFLGEAVTEPRYTLLDLGSFPGMIAGGTTAVYGELYEVGLGLLARLDRHEGVPRFYIRTTVHMAERAYVQSYLLVDPDRIRGSLPVCGGTWTPSY